MFNGHTCQRAQSIGLACDKAKMQVEKKGFKTIVQLINLLVL
jgi:hypothetical protein